jgi:hypothetical protein
MRRNAGHNKVKCGVAINLRRRLGTLWLPRIEMARPTRSSVPAPIAGDDLQKTAPVFAHPSERGNRRSICATDLLLATRVGLNSSLFDLRACEAGNAARVKLSGRLFTSG